MLFDIEYGFIVTLQNTIWDYRELYSQT